MRATVLVSAASSKASELRSSWGSYNSAHSQCISVPEPSSGSSSAAVDSPQPSSALSINEDVADTLNGHQENTGFTARRPKRGSPAGAGAGAGVSGSRSPPRPSCDYTRLQVLRDALHHASQEGRSVCCGARRPLPL